VQLELCLYLHQIIKYFTMKKTLLLGALVLLGFSSCKKDYKCTCTVGGFSNTVEYNDLTKDEAETIQNECELSTVCTWSTQ
jgi:hypothetical protein